MSFRSGAFALKIARVSNEFALTLSLSHRSVNPIIDSPTVLKIRGRRAEPCWPGFTAKAELPAKGFALDKPECRNA
jgi:hypothetical protein